jgi:hypothetical protein
MIWNFAGVNADLPVDNRVLNGVLHVSAESCARFGLLVSATETA